jgi:hypothetical protein
MHRPPPGCPKTIANRVLRLLNSRTAPTELELAWTQVRRLGASSAETNKIEKPSRQEVTTLAITSLIVTPFVQKFRSASHAALYLREYRSIRTGVSADITAFCQTQRHSVVGVMRLTAGVVACESRNSVVQWPVSCATGSCGARELEWYIVRIIGVHERSDLHEYVARSTGVSPKNGRRPASSS